MILYKFKSSLPTILPSVSLSPALVFKGDVFQDDSPSQRLNFFFLNLIRGGGGVQLHPLGTAATDWPPVPVPDDYDDGEFGGMKIGRETTPASLCPSQIPLDQTRDRTRATMVENQRLTT
jgi:hypothetical protein